MTCIADACTDRPVSRGYCNRHRLRLKKHGSLNLPPRERPLIDRILGKLRESSSGCWEWTGATNTSGYGVVGRGARGAGNVLVHRAMYEIHIAEIPDGLHIDHLCRNKRCANPWHLDPVTQAVNNNRMSAGWRASNVFV